MATLSLHRPKIYLWLLIACAVIVFTSVAWLRHARFETQAFDMGIFEQLFWNAAHGRGFVDSLQGIPHHFSLHFSPWLYVLLPGYKIFPTPYYLLLMQSVALALGAIPVYALAARALRSSGLALFWAAQYLMLASLHGLIMYDFHTIAFVVPLLLAALYFIENKQSIPAGIFLLLSASTQEDGALAALFVALFWLWRTARADQKSSSPRSLSALIVVGLGIYFAVTMMYVIPSFGESELLSARYGKFGDTPVEIAWGIVSHPLQTLQTILTPAKASYVYFLFLSVGCMPLGAGVSFIMLIPGLLQNLLTDRESQFVQTLQYDAILIPGLIAAAVYGMKNFIRRWSTIQRHLVAFIFLTTLLVFFVRSPLSPGLFPYRIVRARAPEEKALLQLFARIPPEKSVTAHYRFVPHLAHREKIFMLGPRPQLSDVAIFNLTDSFGFKNEQALRAHLNEYEIAGQYHKFTIGQQYVIFTRPKVKLN